MSRYKQLIVGPLSLLGNVATVAAWAGVSFSTIGAAIGGFWLSNLTMKPLYVVLVTVALFATLLWSVIGLLWIYSFIRYNRENKAIPKYDCSYGMVLANFHFNCDESSDERHVQLEFAISNTLDFPVKFQVFKGIVVLGRTLPPVEAPVFNEGILSRTGSVTYRLTAFPKQMFLSEQTLNGTIDLDILYGHPTIGYTRRRKYGCNIILNYSRRSTKLFADSGGNVAGPFAFGPIPISMTVSSDSDGPV